MAYNGLVQDRGNSTADTLELPNSCTKPLLYIALHHPTWHIVALCKTVVTPLLTHWSYHNISLSHCYTLLYIIQHGIQWPTTDASCKTVVTPLLTHWSYHSLALSHRYTLLYITHCSIAYSVSGHPLGLRFWWYMSPVLFMRSCPSLPAFTSCNYAHEWRKHGHMKGKMHQPLWPQLG